MNRSNVYNIIHLSICFLLIFMSYSVAQTFQTSSDHAQDGALAVGIIYSVFCLANLVLSSYVTQLIGVKLTLVLSSITYSLFIGSNILYYRWNLFISSFLLGIGAALLWTAQGAYVTIATTNHEELNHLPPSSTRGFMNGLFSGLYVTSQTFGNLLAAYLFHRRYAQWIIFTIMTMISSSGTLTMIFLRPVTIPVDPKAKEKKPSPLRSLSIIIDKPFMYLISTMCCAGLAQGFIYGAIPPLIIDKSLKFLIFALAGTANAIGSVLFGKLSDLLRHRLIIFGIGVFCHLAMFTLFLTIWKAPFDQSRIDIFVIMGIFLSIGDAIYMSQLNSVLAIFYGRTRPADAFAAFKVFQAGASAVGFVQQIYFSFSTQVIILIILSIISYLLLIYGNCRIKSLNNESTPTEAPVTLELGQEDKSNMDVHIPLAKNVEDT